MLILPNQVSGTRTLIILAFTWALFAAFATESSAQGWELRTTTIAVPGTYEIENGSIEKAIRISEVQLSHASQRQKVAVLNNLCIGHILRDDLETALVYCDKAIDRPNEKTVSYNNRGVLKALQGDVEGAMRDFEKAAMIDCLGECSAAATVPRDLPRPVARRNLSKAEYVVELARTAGDEAFTARVDE